jgi:hypothetical protein
MKRTGWVKDDADGIGAPGVSEPGIYAITFRDKVVYIGQSTDIAFRISQHLSGYKRVFGAYFHRGARIDHYLHGTWLGATRFPDVYPIGYKWVIFNARRREREERELRLIGRVKPIVNKAGVK